MDRPASTSLLDHFAALEDPRQTAKVLYPLPEILLLLLGATLAGADDFIEMELWGNEQLAFLRRLLPYRHGIPSHDTLGEVVAALDPALFKACFMSWVEGLRETEPDLIAIDGKTVRRSFDRRNGRSPLHLVSAFAVEHGLVLAQRATDAKRGELTVLPDLLDGLDLRGCLVSLDALACRPEIAARIADRGGDYLLALKGNQNKAHAEVKRWFEAKLATAIRSHWAIENGLH